jgi:hypothetical protein
MFLQLRELLVVRGEKRARAALGCAVPVLDDRPRDREPVVGRGAAADLVEDDQRTIGVSGKDTSRLVDADLERRATQLCGPFAGHLLEGAEERHPRRPGMEGTHGLFRDGE